MRGDLLCICYCLWSNEVKTWPNCLGDYEAIERVAMESGKQRQPIIRCEIECLETDFANDLSIDELAVQAQVSRSHFALIFQCTQNKDHKDCQKPPFLYEQD